MSKKLLIIVFVVVAIFAVASVTVVSLTGLLRVLPPAATPTPSLAPTPTFTPTSTPLPTPEPKPTMFSQVSLDTSGGNVIRGYLTKSSWESGCIPNATIELVDATSGVVYGQTQTLSEIDLGRNLNVGGFSFTLPVSLVDMSVQAVFHGNSEWSGCVSVVVTVYSGGVTIGGGIYK